MELRDKHVLVTGASKGVGAALAAELSRRGARLTLAARPSAELDRAAADTGGTALPVDLADFAALDGYVERAESANGPLEVLVNNAALVSAGPLETLTREHLAQQLSANLLAPIELCRQALPGMLARGSGTLVNVSSMVAEIGVPNLPAYVSAKAGLTKFALDLQRDLEAAAKPVRTLLVVLGEIPGTQINDGFRADASVSALADRFAKLPVLTVDGVAQSIAKSLDRDRRSALVLPRYNGLLFHLRQLPVRLTGRLVPAPEESVSRLTSNKHNQETTR